MNDSRRRPRRHPRGVVREALASAPRDDRRTARVRRWSPSVHRRLKMPPNGGRLIPGVRRLRCGRRSSARGRGDRGHHGGLGDAGRGGDLPRPARLRAAGHARTHGLPSDVARRHGVRCVPRLAPRLVLGPVLGPVLQRGAPAARLAAAVGRRAPRRRCRGQWPGNPSCPWVAPPAVPASARCAGDSQAAALPAAWERRRPWGRHRAIPPEMPRGREVVDPAWEVP